MRQIFEKRALSKRHSSGEKKSPIVVLSPPLQLTLGFGVLLAFVGILWSFLAKVPIQVNGTGVLLPVGVINTVSAGADGFARRTFDYKQYNWIDEAEKFRLEPQNFSDPEVVDLARRILISYSSSQELPELNDQKVLSEAKLMRRGTLLMWLQSLDSQESLENQFESLVSLGRLNRVQQRTLSDQQLILKKELDSRQSFLDSMKALAVKGFVSKPTILQNQAEVDRLESQIYTNQDSLVKLQTDLKQSYIKLRQSLAHLISSGLIFARHDLYIHQIIPNDGEMVSKGDLLLLLSHHSLTNPSRVPVFLSAREAAQVVAGMDVLLTPVGMRRSEVGGIRGRVVEMSELPSGKEEIVARIGVSALSDVILQSEPSPTMAVVELERSSLDETGNRGGYVWNSKGDLPFAPKSADQLTASITTRQVAPISLVIPRLRVLFGLVPPEKTPVTQSNLAQPDSSEDRNTR